MSNRESCPHCPDTFMNKDGLRRHMIHRHRLSDESTMLPSEVLDERPVDLVQLPAGPTHQGTDPSHGGLTTHRGTRDNCSGPDCGPVCCKCGEGPVTYQNHQGSNFCQSCSDGSDRNPVLCVCGGMLELIDGGTDDPWWTHAGPSHCEAAAPVAGMPTKADRDHLHRRLRDNGKALDKAAGEMSKLRDAMDAVDEHMKRMQASLDRPSAIRLATLNDVWDKLHDAGDMKGLRIVMDMIKNTGDE